MRNFTIPIFILLYVHSVISQNVLNYFNATSNDKNIFLEWQMTQGQTCDGIRILHSVDSTTFNEIGFIGGICGSKIETVTYQFTHQNPRLNSKNHYRLEFGNVGPSETVSVLHLDFSKGYIIQPHPAQNNALLFFKPTNPNYKLLIFQQNGQLMHTSETDQNYFELSRDRIPIGIHFFEIIDARGVRITSGKMVFINE